MAIKTRGVTAQGTFEPRVAISWLEEYSKRNVEPAGMFISEISASGFRCFGVGNALTLQLRPGLNILVGPNDAGKTAIIDVPRYVLWTRGDDYVRLEASDFHVDAKGNRASELLIRCTFDDLSPAEEARFLEWCTNESGRLRLYVCLRAFLRKLSGGGATVSTQQRLERMQMGYRLKANFANT